MQLKIFLKRQRYLNKMLQATEQKMKAALNKSDSNILRSKSAEPTDRPVNFIKRPKYKTQNLYKDALNHLSSVCFKLSCQSSFTKLKLFSQKSSQDLLRPTKQIASKDIENNRYLKRSKSSLNEQKSFELIEKELKNVIKDERKATK